MYEWMIVYEAMTQVSHRRNVLAYSYTSGVIQPGGGLAPPIISILYYIKRLIVLI